MSAQVAESIQCQVLIASSLISGRRVWFIGLDLKDEDETMTLKERHIIRASNGYIDMKPFIGTEKQRDDYVEQLVIECKKQGIPIKAIDTAPISLAK